MSESSIYDRMPLRQSTLRKYAQAQKAAAPAPTRYDPERLRVIDGVALTAAGLVGWGSVPAASSPVVDRTLSSTEVLLTHPVALPEAFAGSITALIGEPARRVHELGHALLCEALNLVEPLPAEANVDVYVSTALDIREQAQALCQSLASVLRTSPRISAVRQASAHEDIHDDSHEAIHEDIHDLLAAPESGGASHVLWLSIDTLLHAQGIASLRDRGALASLSDLQGLKPAEASVALLFERVQEDAEPLSAGIWLTRGKTQTYHRHELSTRQQRRQHLRELVAQGWQDGSTESLNGRGDTPGKRPKDESGGGEQRDLDTGSAGAPFVVVDHLDVSGDRAVLGSVLMERWPEFELGEDCLSIDAHFGWPGQSAIALSLVVATVELQRRGAQATGALLLTLMDDNRRQTLALRAIAEPIDAAATSSLATA